MKRVPRRSNIRLHLPRGRVAAVEPSAHAGDQMSDTPPPQAPEASTSDTEPREPTQENSKGEKTFGWTTAGRAFRRWAEAFDTSRIGEGAISAVIVVVLAVGVVSNLPESAITRLMSPVIRPIALGLGLDQSWALFAPIPPHRQEYIEVHVAMAGGVDKVWTLPQRNRILGVAFSHRWRKFKESLLTNEEIRPDFVHWVVRKLSAPDDRPVRVDMLLLTQDLPPPGVDEPEPIAVQTLYSENLAGNR